MLLPDDAYGGTFRFFARVLGEQGVEWSVADLTDLDAVAAAMRPDDPKLVWVETPTNPLLRIVDIAAIAAAGPRCRGAGVVDNTFATPYLQRPLELGADVVLHSTTKYLGGHSDVVGGALVTADAGLHERLRFLQNAAGPVPGPFDAYLVLRGHQDPGGADGPPLRPTPAGRRVPRPHDPRVAEVLYPGLPSIPSHDLAAAPDGAVRGDGVVPARGRSRGGPPGGVGHRASSCSAESLGGVESLIEVPAAMTHASVVGRTWRCPPTWCGSRWASSTSTTCSRTWTGRWAEAFGRVPPGRFPCRTESLPSGSRPGS